MTLKEIKKLEELNRKKCREDNERRQGALGIGPKPVEKKVVTPDLIIGKTPEERAEYFRKLREGAGLND